jgi:hypothetical protein
MNFKFFFKGFPLAIFSIVLALFFTLVLIYFNFYVHELGHANSNLIYTTINHINSTTINFTYQNFILFGRDLGLNYPQQTITVMPSIMSIYGVLFSLVFYALIFLLLAKIELIRNNNYLGVSLGIAFLTLIIQDIVSNLFCGTDGLDLACSALTFNIISWFFWATLLLSLGFFFNILLVIIINKFKSRKNERRGV